MKAKQFTQTIEISGQQFTLWNDPAFSPGYVHFCCGSVATTPDITVYPQYASVGHGAAVTAPECPQVTQMGGKCNCPRIVALDSALVVEAARAFMRAYFAAESAEQEQEEEQVVAELDAQPVMPAPIRILFERYGGAAAIVRGEMPSERAWDAEDAAACFELRRWNV